MNRTPNPALSAAASHPRQAEQASALGLDSIVAVPAQVCATIRRRPLRLAVVALCLALTSACANSPAPAEPPEPAPVHLSAEDMRLADGAVQKALETALSGTAVQWRNNRTNHFGSVTPQRSYLAKGGFYCRLYVETINLGTQTRRYRDRACRAKGGIWEQI